MFGGSFASVRCLVFLSRELELLGKDNGRRHRGQKASLCWIREGAGPGDLTSRSGQRLRLQWSVVEARVGMRVVDGKKLGDWAAGL